MEILGRDISEKFERFYNEQSEALQFPIVFKDIRTHPDPLVRQSNGKGDLVDDTIVVWLNPHLPLDHLEALAAHEIMHFTLQYTQGFPYWGGPAGIELEFQYIWEVAASTVQDLLVNQRIAEWSFDSSLDQEMGMGELLKKLDSPSFKEPPLHSLKGMHLALKYAGFSLGHQSKTTGRVLSRFKAVCPRIVQLGESLIDAIRIHGYETPKQQIRSLRTVRAILGLSPDDYKIWDWSIEHWC